jgi:hypothetical protein
MELNVIDCKDCLSGQVQCEQQVPQCDITGQCLGNLDVATIVEHKVDCLKKCQTNEDCSWFTFETESRLCEEFLTCPSIDEGSINCISGERSCKTDQVKGV